MSQLLRRIATNGHRLIKNTANIVTTSTVRATNDNYEGDGKTTVNILNNDFELGLLINSYSEVRRKRNTKSQNNQFMAKKYFPK